MSPFPVIIALYITLSRLLLSSIFFSSSYVHPDICSFSFFIFILPGHSMGRATDSVVLYLYTNWSHEWNVRLVEVNWELYDSEQEIIASTRVPSLYGPPGLDGDSFQRSNSLKLLTVPIRRFFFFFFFSPRPLAALGVCFHVLEPGTTFRNLLKVFNDWEGGGTYAEINEMRKLRRRKMEFRTCINLW